MDPTAPSYPDLYSSSSGTYRSSSPSSSTTTTAASTGDGASKYYATNPDMVTFQASSLKCVECERAIASSSEPMIAYPCTHITHVHCSANWTQETKSSICRRCDKDIKLSSLSISTETYRVDDGNNPSYTRQLEKKFGKQGGRVEDSDDDDDASSSSDSDRDEDSDEQMMTLVRAGRLFGTASFTVMKLDPEEDKADILKQIHKNKVTLGKLAECGLGLRYLKKSLSLKTLEDIQREFPKQLKRKLLRKFKSIYSLADFEKYYNTSLPMLKLEIGDLSIKYLHNQAGYGYQQLISAHGVKIDDLSEESIIDYMQRDTFFQISKDIPLRIWLKAGMNISHLRALEITPEEASTRLKWNLSEAVSKLQLTPNEKERYNNVIAAAASSANNMRFTPSESDSRRRRKKKY